MSEFISMIEQKQQQEDNESIEQQQEEIRKKRNQYHREYSLKHPDYAQKKRDTIKQYKKSHVEETKEYNKRYAQEHREQIKEYNKKYMTEHKEDMKQYYKLYNEKKAIFKLFHSDLSFDEAQQKFFRYKRLTTRSEFKELFESLLINQSSID